MKKSESKKVRWLLLLLILWCVALFSLHGCHKATPDTAVVKLLNETGGGGTGFEVIAPSGKVYVLTNKHICEAQATNVSIDGEIRPLRIIEVSSKTDLCLLDAPIGAQGLTVANLHPKRGDLLDIWGYGLLLPLTETSGRWVAKFPVPVLSVDSPEYTTAPILPGNSGSPVLNQAGEVVGVAYATGEVLDSRALIVGLDDVKEFLRVY